jgi:hypothetical protein
MIREFFPLAPNQKPESDIATRLRLKGLREILEVVGEARFFRAIELATFNSRNRFDCSVMKVREFAGLSTAPPRSPAVVAWEQVIQVFLDHVRTDGDGNYRLEDKVRMVNGLAAITKPPEVREASLRALRSIGGWAAIAEAWPEYIGQRLREFEKLYEP